MFAPNSKRRAWVTPAGRGRGSKPKATDKGQEQTPAERGGIDEPQAQRLKRVFRIDIATYRACAGAVRAIACIADPVVSEKILTPFEEKCASARASRLLPRLAPPQAHLFP